MTVPTALERVGNFSQTFIRDENGNPMPARIFDPFNVTQVKAGSLPPRRDSRTRSSRIRIRTRCGCSASTRCRTARRTTSYNTNNFEATTTQTVRRHSSNNRVDFKWKNHSIYGSGGISYAEIITPRPFGTAPFNDAAGIAQRQEPVHPGRRCDRAQPDAACSTSATGSAASTPRTSAATRTGFTDYASFGVPDNLLPLMLYPGQRRRTSTPNGYGGGNGGGSNWTALSAGNFGTKREFQTNHSVTGSLTKMRGKWVHKAGVEFRNLLSNYDDPEQASVGDAVAVRAPGRQLQLRVRDRERRRGVSS